MLCHENPSFIPNTQFQFVWDSTSLGLAKTCLRKYYYSMVLGYRPKAEAIPLTYGVLYHKGIEIFHQLHWTGMEHQAALEETIKRILVLSRDFKSPDTTRNRANLIRTLVWHFEHFRPDPFSTVVFANNKPAVELSFKLPIPIESRIFGAQIILSGHLDRLAIFQDKYWIVDAKTTGSTLSPYYFQRYSPDNQVSLYTFAGKAIYNTNISGVVIDAVQLGVNFSRYSRQIISRTESQLEEWYNDLTFHISTIEQAALSGHWPMNDTACDKYGGCPFREVCSRSPEVRETFLAQDFHKVMWNPLENRNE